MFLHTLGAQVGPSSLVFTRNLESNLNSLSSSVLGGDTNGKPVGRQGARS